MTILTRNTLNTTNGGGHDTNVADPAESLAAFARGIASGKEPWVLLLLLASSLIAVLAAFIAPEYAVYAAAIPVGFVVGIVMFVRPELTLLVMIAWIPLQNMDVPGLPGSLSVNKIMGAILLGAFFFAILFRGRRFRIFDDIYDYMMFLFLATIAFSGLDSFNSNLVVNEIDRIIRLMALYFVVKNLISNRAMFHAVLWAIVIGGTIAAIGGLNTYAQVSSTNALKARVGGINMDPNAYAMMSMLFLYAALHLIEVTPRWTLKAVLMAIVGIILASIVVTSSRSGFLTLGITGFIYLWRHPHRKILGVVVLVAPFFLFPVLPDSVLVRFGLANESARAQQVSQNAAFTLERRASYVVYSGELIPQQPVTGYGYKTFSRLYPLSDFAEINNPIDTRTRYRVAHNTYLDLAVGIGFIGTGLYIALIALAIWDCYRVQRILPRGGVEWAAASTFQMGLIAMMIGSLFLSIETSEFIWILLGAASAVTFYARKQMTLTRRSVAA